MNFCSDNVSGVAPAIMAAIQEANRGDAMGYGNDRISARLEARCAELFERDVAVFPVATGTAANALALAAIVPAHGAILCHELAHINVDECGAPELFTGGAKLIDMPGPHGKLSAAGIAEVLAGYDSGNVHQVQPAAISLTQATERGTVYTREEIAAIADIAHRRGLKLHLDGTRFANALAHSGIAPAELSWRAGVDVLSLGATKNGAMAAEAILFFDRALAAKFGYLRKRAGHLFSKMRFVAAQLEAYLSDDLWLRNATHSNRMARRLADGLRRVPGARVLDAVEANLFYVRLPAATIAGLESDGFRFYHEGGPETIRLVTAFDTDQGDVDAFVASAAQHAAATPSSPRESRAARQIGE